MGIRVWRSVRLGDRPVVVLQKKTIGAWNDDAQTNASLTSPWLVAPSPKNVMTAASAPSFCMPIA